MQVPPIGHADRQVLEGACLTVGSDMVDVDVPHVIRDGTYGYVGIGWPGWRGDEVEDVAGAGVCPCLPGRRS